MVKDRAKSKKENKKNVNLKPESTKPKKTDAQKYIDTYREQDSIIMKKRNDEYLKTVDSWAD